MKKKILPVILCVIMAAVCLAGCGSNAKLADSKYVGTWTGTTVEYSGMQMELASIFPDGFTIEFTAEGKVTLDVSGDKTSGKWDETENGVIIDPGTDNEVELQDQDGNLVISYDGLNIICVKSE